MFILQSDIPRELFNKLTIKEEQLDTLTISNTLESTDFTEYKGTGYIVTNTFDQLLNIIKDTAISIIIDNTSYAPYPTLSFISE